MAGWRDSDLFNARERTALDYAEAMTLSTTTVTDAHIAALRAHLTDDAIVELTGLIAFQNLSSKFNAALGVPPQGFCAIQADAPPAAGTQGGHDVAEMSAQAPKVTASLDHSR